jgi:AbiV family abortive infection protein
MVKRNRGSLDKVPREELKSCAEHALRNAYQYIGDAKVLIRKESYGHAYALLVLSVEEIVKALACKERLEGRLDGSELKDFFIKHMVKQKFVFRKLIEEVNPLTIMFYRPFLSNEAKSLIQRKQKEVKPINGVFNYSEIIKPEIEEILKQKDNILREISKMHEIMQKRKEIGLYVDFDSENKVISPAIIDKRETERLFEYTDSLYSIVHGIIFEDGIYYLAGSSH